MNKREESHWVIYDRTANRTLMIVYVGGFVLGLVIGFIISYSYFSA